MLTLATSDGPLTATTPAQSGIDYSSLIDAKVLIRGVAAALFNQKLEMTGIRLLFPELAAITVEEPPPEDPFSSPILPIDRLMQYSETSVLRHRVQLRGRATLHWPGRTLCIQDEKNGRRLGGVVARESSLGHDAVHCLGARARAKDGFAQVDGAGSPFLWHGPRIDVIMAPVAGRLDGTMRGMTAGNGPGEILSVTVGSSQIGSY